MKSLLFLICLMFSFLSYSIAKPANSVKEKQKSESESPPLQIAILPQNEMLFEPFEFGNPFSHYINYVGTHQKEKKRFLKPKNGAKPCKIPIKPRTRNKDNI